MTEIEARNAPLWEVWDWFDKLGKYIETEKFLNSFGKKGSDGLSHDGRNHSDDDEQFQMMRAVLLDRCADVSDQYRHWPPATIEKSIEHNKYMAAVHLFWVWELEQRQKESPN